MSTPDDLPAISLWQPWATLISVGAKRYETRSWSTRHRGPMAIHAGLKWTVRMALQCYEEPYFRILSRAGVKFPARCDGTKLQKLGLPFGAVLAVAELVEVRPAGDVIREIGGDERAFGDFTHGRYAWEYGYVIRLEDPVPYRGEQGIFRIRGEALESVNRQLSEHSRCT